jgi:predicted O-methyltransferase YrrM
MLQGRRNDIHFKAKAKLQQLLYMSLLAMQTLDLLFMDKGKSQYQIYLGHCSYVCLAHLLPGKSSLAIAGQVKA